MSIYEDLISGKEKLAVVGLGYVGMPIAVEFSKHVKVIGFDINKEKINAYLDGKDPTNEVGDEAIKSCSVEWTADEKKLKEACFIIVAVPTPINDDTTPNFSSIISSSQMVGRNLRRGTFVVFESTVYPGVTEEICLPILERESGLICGKDFKIGYSPERINPGDRIHRLTNIKKIVSGIDDESLDEIAKVYSIVVEAGVHRASSIQVAEAAKVIENSQRDINIAFMNELSIIFNKMGIDTLEVLEAAGTKWNFLPFRPGLVGGHCIGIDPYYLTYRAEQFGYHSQVVLSGRRINDGMGKYIAEQAAKQLIAADKSIKDAKVGILGITFKEDCPDVRNSKVYTIINELNEYGINPLVCDPVADVADTKRYYGIDLLPIEDFRNLDCLIIAVAHSMFRELSDGQLMKMFGNSDTSKCIIIDVKGIRDKNKFKELGYRYWRL
ncbi:MAG: nucleotide sugar dehydrogenase [Clostridiales bacterium]|nr:nucleotide sugar dehydrogenase [Clostridiales bacterium]